MPGNASTAELSSIVQSPEIGEIALRPRPRKKPKRPPCNTGAGRHRNSGIGNAGSIIREPEFSDTSQAHNTLNTPPTLVHRCSPSFSLSNERPSIQTSFQSNKATAEHAGIHMPGTYLKTFAKNSDSHVEWTWCDMLRENERSSCAVRRSNFVRTIA